MAASLGVLGGAGAGGAAGGGGGLEPGGVPARSAAEAAAARRGGGGELSGPPPSARSPPPRPTPPLRFFRARVLEELPHDTSSYTQGLLYRKECSPGAGSNRTSSCQDVLYESAGLYGQSTLRRVALRTGEVLQSRRMPGEVFAEGLAVNPRRPDELVQLAWRTSAGFTYDRETLALTGEFSTTLGDGWGLTSDSEHLIATDSGNVLHFLDPDTFRPVRAVPVTDAAGRPLYRLNELEWVEGEVWANVYGKSCIARIDPGSGAVAGWVVGVERLLRDEHGATGEVLNGIAYDPGTRRLWVTGKNWNKVFQMELYEVQEAITARDLRSSLNCMF